MLPAILRMIVPAVSDESRAGGAHGQKAAARRFTLDRKHAAARGVLRSRVRQSAASRESSWTAGTPPSMPACSYTVPTSRIGIDGAESEAKSFESAKGFRCL